MTVDVDALLEAVALKALPRTGWGRRGIEGAESVAAHSWGVAWLVLALLPDDLDRGRALAYAVLHDLPEVRTGDLVPSDGVPPAEKARREAEALDDLAASLPDVAALWHAYERQQDAEARFVRQLDRVDMALQAVAYARAGLLHTDEFLRSAEAFVTHPRLVEVLAAARSRLP